MVRVQEERGQWYAVEIDSVEDDAENIEIRIAEYGPVIIADTVYDAAQLLGIDWSKIKIVD